VQVIKHGHKEREDLTYLRREIAADRLAGLGTGKQINQFILAETDSKEYLSQIFLYRIVIFIYEV
jgi:hypothetical protein